MYAIRSYYGFDTLWIAEWDFDVGIGVCDPSGWTTFDRRNPAAVLGTETHWQVRGDFSGIGGISGQAGIIGAHDLCWPFPDGYDNNWYQAIEIPYLGASYLSFDYLVDSEEGFDFLQVEIDSACASRELELSTNIVITSYSIHYTKLYDLSPTSRISLPTARATTNPTTSHPKRKSIASFISML